MQEFLHSAQGIFTIIATALGGTTGIAALVSQIVLGARNKRYSAMVASSSAKDQQIEELKDMTSQVITVIGLMMSAFTTQQLSSMALTPEVKKQIIAIADQVEKVTNIKLDNTVEKAIKIMTTVDPKAVTETQKQEIMDTANKTQEALTAVNEEAANLADSLEL